MITGFYVQRMGNLFKQGVSPPSSKPTFCEQKSAEELVLGWLGTTRCFPGEAERGAWAGAAGAGGAGGVAGDTGTGRP